MIKRGPSDEFYDLSLIEKECIDKVDLSEDQDGGLIKYKIKEPTALFERRVEEADHVYYTHETRFDNGQLVDFDEKRKAKEKFEMADERSYEYIRAAFLTMRKGEIVWLKIGPKHHKNIYHTFCSKDHLKPGTKIGQDIYLRLAIDSIKRLPPYLDSKTYEGKLAYFKTVREISKELIAEKEYANA